MTIAAPAKSFRLAVPEDWLLQEEGGPVTIVRESPSAPGVFAANVNVVRCQLDEVRDIDAIVVAASEGMARLLTDCVELEREAGDEGHLVIAYRQGPNELIAAQRYVVADDGCFVITATSTKSDWAVREALLAGLVDSFEIVAHAGPG